MIRKLMITFIQQKIKQEVITMNKSLTERIGEHTREVIAERKAKQRAQNKIIVLSALAEHIESNAKRGLIIFFNKEKNELRFSLDTYSEMLKISIEDVKMAIKDIGFEIHNPCNLLNVAAIPQENVSNEIRDLLKMYYEILNDFEKKKSKCKR